MNQESEQRIRSIDDLDTVVDCDFHLTEKEADFLPYLPSPYYERLFKRETFEKDYLEHTDEFKSFYPSPGVFAPYNTGVVESREVSTIEDIREAKEFLGVDKPLCTPSKNLYLPGVQNDDFAAALAHAYNGWLVDEIVSSDENVFGAVVAAPQKPTAAAEEIDRLSDENGIVATFVPSGGVHPPLGDERYFPIYEASADAGFPVVFHSASGAIMDSFPFQKHGFNRYLPQHATAHPMQYMVHTASMITNGVPVRFPDTHFVFQESGLGWVPYMMRRLNHEYKTEPDDAPLLEKKPSEYFVDQFKFTTQPIEGEQDPMYVNSILRLMQAEKTVMFSSDYPHYDFDNSNQLLKLVRSEFSSQEIRNMYGETATDIYPF